MCLTRMTFAAKVKPGDTVVVQGEGLVGNLYSQALRQREPAG